ncbi:Lipoprotein signal peptidase [Poriferisphaera corsica]|uniref:Lipoprotein signal peptidase n=1 Tax=Poriferisphaera corsica TaxID=2528020 RepID=A0A517YRR6_9BACT|nr:signal peptidase II [Poriferisphaera corsica]QDU32922.1 Lipoprotein signal peptidase [Poriferisphaera corsica]
MNPENTQPSPPSPPSPASGTPTPSLCAYKSPRAIIVFLAATITLLAADLLIKHYAFEYVAPHPVDILAAAPDMTPTEYPSLSTDAKRYQIYVFPTAADRIPTREEPVVVIPYLLNLQLTLNTGAVFGLGKGARPIFIAISLIALVVISLFFARSPAKSRLFHLGLACILAGALGNLYDRAVYSAVRDMFHMLPTTRLYPWIFNLADVQLLIGVALVILHGWLYSDEQPQQPKQ